jgi:hypothetical protein
MADNWLERLTRWINEPPIPQPHILKKGPGPRGALYPLKTPVDVGQYRVSIEEIEGPYLSPNQDKGPAAPEPTTHLFSAEVLIINISSKNEARNYGYDRFRLYDEKGYVFSALDSGQKNRREPLLSNGILSVGLWVRGWVTWELPIAIIPHRVQFFSGYLTEASVDFLVKG